MNKKIALLVGCSVLIAISCALIKKGENEPQGDRSRTSFHKGELKKNEEKPVGSGSEDKPKLPDQVPYPPEQELPKPVPKPDRPNPDPVKPVTQYDSAALDAKVRAEAEHFHKDPKTYRMLVKTDGQGNRVYRMMGMHVIVSSQGEETFLPDEI